MTWEKIIKEYHKDRKHTSESEMTNSDFCNFLVDNYNAPEKNKLVR